MSKLKHFYSSNSIKPDGRYIFPDFKEAYTKEELREIFIEAEGEINLKNTRTSKYDYGRYEDGFYKGLETMYNFFYNK
jgi:hypothetical protein